MALEKMRRFMFILAAVALFLATVVPSVDASANVIGSTPAVTMTAMDGMDCPDRDTSRDTMIGCMQAICIGFAVIADGEYFGISAARPAYAVAAVALPDDVELAPSTPPI